MQKKTSKKKYRLAKKKVNCIIIGNADPSLADIEDLRPKAKKKPMKKAK